MQHINDSFLAELQQLGLSAPEAQIYMTLTAKGSLGAAAIAQDTGIQRSNVYPILWSLADRGLVEGGTGYGSKFVAVPPDEALPSLVMRERETLLERERLAVQLAQRMASFMSSSEAAPEELIQVVRNPKVIAERFERLQLDAERQVDVMIRAPILNPRRDNPVQEQAQRRGVRFRGLYERAAIEDPAIEPYVKAWVAGGEEARVYDGKLPHKLAIFDTHVVLLPLSMPGDQMRTLFIRHHELAQSLTIMFETLWERAVPLNLGQAKRGNAARSGKKVVARKTGGPRVVAHRNNSVAH